MTLWARKLRLTEMFSKRTLSLRPFNARKVVSTVQSSSKDEVSRRLHNSSSLSLRIFAVGIAGMLLIIRGCVSVLLVGGDLCHAPHKSSVTLGSFCAPMLALLFLRPCSGLQFLK